jgi:hypothetical protein
MKYALILAFSYPKILGSNYDISTLKSVIYDIKMMYEICLNLEIEEHNITIITDILILPEKINNCNIKNNPIPSDIFVCRELSQFVENTIRGIEDNLYKGGEDDFPEVLVYISGHGSEIKIDDIDNQSIILTNYDGTSLKYLLSKDIFNIIFGNLYIDNFGKMSVPIYSKIRKIRKIENDKGIYFTNDIVGEKGEINIYLTQPIASPIVSPKSSPLLLSKPYRSNYLANRGIPVSTKMLIIVDTCYSAHMTHFPYIYNPKTQLMCRTHNFNIDFDSELPYCVTISSCESNKTSGIHSNGSSLTKILHLKLFKLKSKINVSQLHYLIYNSSNFIIQELLKRESTHPIITSTLPSSEILVPFFNFKETKIIKVIEK